MKARELGLAGFANPETLEQEAIRSLAGNIILTTSGMLSEAFSEALFKPLAGMETTAIFLVGYQDPKSTGGKLKKAHSNGHIVLEIDGNMVAVGEPMTENVLPMFFIVDDLLANDWQIYEPGEIKST